MSEFTETIKDLVRKLEDSPPITNRTMRVFYRPLVTRFVDIGISSVGAHQWLLKMKKDNELSKDFPLPGKTTLRDWMGVIRKERKSPISHYTETTKSLPEQQVEQDVVPDPITKSDKTGSKPVVSPPKPASTTKKPSLPPTTTANMRKRDYSKANNMSVEDCQFIFPQITLKDIEVENTLDGKKYIRVDLSLLPKSVKPEAMGSIPEELKAYYWHKDELDDMTYYKEGIKKTHIELYGFTIINGKEYRE